MEGVTTVRRSVCTLPVGSAAGIYRLRQDQSVSAQVLPGVTAGAPAATVRPMAMPGGATQATTQAISQALKPSTKQVGTWDHSHAIKGNPPRSLDSEGGSTD